VQHPTQGRGHRAGAHRLHARRVMQVCSAAVSRPSASSRTRAARVAAATSGVLASRTTWSAGDAGGREAVVREGSLGRAHRGTSQYVAMGCSSTWGS
jgi:hypothetical protein